MKRKWFAACLAGVLLLAGCGGGKAQEAITGDAMIGEYFRVFVSYGVITLALIMYEIKKRRARSRGGELLALAQKEGGAAS